MIIEYKGKTPRVHPSAFVAPTAVLIGDVEVGEEASIWFGTVVRGDNGPIRIGALSPRMTVPNQMLASSPTSTSPINTAVGAMNADAATLGVFPLNSMNIMDLRRSGDT